MKSLRTRKNNPFLVFGIALLTVCILSAYPKPDRSKSKGKVYQVFYQINSEHTSEVAQALTDKLSKNFQAEDFFCFVLADQSTVEILTSSSANRSNIEEVFEYVTQETEFEDQALIQGVQMCLDRIRQDNNTTSSSLPICYSRNI